MKGDAKKRLNVEPGEWARGILAIADEGRDAWQAIDSANLKRCPKCGDLALEGEVQCTKCGCAPSDDMTWRDAAPTREPEGRERMAIRHEDGNPHESHQWGPYAESFAMPEWRSVCVHCLADIEDDEALSPCPTREPDEDEGYARTVSRAPREGAGAGTEEADGLTFAALRRANLERLPQFKNKHGEPAHSEPDGSDWSPAQWLQATLGELGEYANLRKKYERGDLTEDEFAREAADELADVQTYLDILAFRVGVDLGAATVSKWNRVSERVGSPARLRATPSSEVVEALRLDADMYANAVDEALAGWPVEKDDREMRAVQVALGELSGHLRALSQFGGTER